MNKKFIFGIIVAILLLAPLASAFSISGLFNWITGKVAEPVSVLLTEGETREATVGGKIYDIHLIGISPTEAVIRVDDKGISFDSQQSVTEGATYYFGDLQVYVKAIYRAAVAGKLSWVELDLTPMIVEKAPSEEDLSAYPAPFVQNGVADVAIIYGMNAPAIYMETVSIFAGSLSSELMAQGGGKLGDVIMIDTEAEANRPLTNLIVVGGANVNDLATELCPHYSASSQYDTLVECGYGGGVALLKLYASPYNPAKKALLVAGWTGESTRYVANLYVSSQVFREGLIGKDKEIIALPEYIRIKEREAEIGEETEEEAEETEKGEKKAVEEEEALKEKLAGCMGCMHDTACVPFGERLKIDEISSYCSIDSVFRPQMPIDAECENDYECLSNECSNGKCISTYSLLQKIFELLKTIFGKGWLWGK